MIVPDAVVEEVTAYSDDAARALATEEWIEPGPAVGTPSSISAWDLGAGESAVLAWAVAHPGTVAVLDDYAARTCAQALNVPLVGTLGLALRAKVSGRVSTAGSLVEELRRAGLYLSDRVVRKALALVGE